MPCIDIEKDYLIQSLLNEYLELEQTRDIYFNIKLNELCDILSPIGYIKAGLKFKDGSDIKNFLSYYKRKLKNNELSPIDKESFECFLNYYDKMNIRLRELTEATEELGFFPVIDKPRSNQDKVRKFSDGTDMGSFCVGTLKKKVESNQLTDEQMNTVLELYGKYSLLKVKTGELRNICDYLGCLPVSRSTNFNSHRVVEFSDGTNVGSFISVTLKKIDNGELTKEETKDFLEIYDKYRSLTFREKVKEAISLAIDIGYIPYSCRRNQRKYKFSDGSYVGAFVSNNRHNFINNKLDGEKSMLFRELMYFDFSKYGEWIRNYQGLKEYMKTHKCLKYVISNSEFSDFLLRQQERYYGVEDKDIVQEVFEEKLFELDDNWINYGRKARKQKVKSQ